MLPDLVSLQLFLRAVRFGSLSKAAQQSHISLPAASRRIQMLEHHFGMPLVERHPSGMVPTPAGEALAKHASTVLAAVESMAADLDDYAAGGAGKVRLLANTSAMRQDLAQRLAEWNDRYPGIRVELKEARSRDILECVARGEADVGVVTSAPVPDLDFTPIGRDELCAFVAQDHPVQVARASLTDLLGHDFVGLPDTAESTAAVRQAAAAAGRYLRMRMQVQSFDALCRLVAAGHGIGILPRGVIDEVRPSMKLRCIELEDDWAVREMYVCTRRDLRAGAVRRFVDFLVAAPLSSAAPNASH